MTRSSQHEQWVRDCRKEEFRELLANLASMNDVLLRSQAAIHFSSAVPHEEWMAIQRKVHNAMISCIYVRRDLKGIEATSKFNAITVDPATIGKSVLGIAVLIAEIAAVAAK